MRPLWFKRRYVAQILSGEKRETVRRDSPSLRKAQVGERFNMSVGAAPPFASARVAKLERLSWSELGESKQSELERLGIVDDGSELVRISFDDVRARGGES